MGEKDEIRKRIEALARFRNALIDLLSMTEFNTDRWGDRPAAVPKAGRETEWREAKALVDQLSVGAAKSFHLAGVVVDWKPRGTFDRYRINPGAEWDTILTYDPKFTPDVLEACMNRAKGALDGGIGECTQSSPALHAKVSLAAPLNLRQVDCRDHRSSSNRRACCACSSLVGRDLTIGTQSHRCQFDSHHFPPAEQIIRLGPVEQAYVAVVWDSQGADQGVTD